MGKDEGGGGLRDTGRHEPKGGEKRGMDRENSLRRNGRCKRATKEGVVNEEMQGTADRGLGHAKEAMLKPAEPARGVPTHKGAGEMKGPITPRAAVGPARITKSTVKMRPKGRGGGGMRGVRLEAQQALGGGEQW